MGYIPAPNGPASWPSIPTSVPVRGVSPDDAATMTRARLLRRPSRRKTVLREYELTFVIQPEISEEGSAVILAKLDEALENGEAKRLLVDDQGKRKLAYPIQKFQKGHYYLLSFLDEGKVVTDLERVLRLEESVLRFLSVRVEDDVADVEARVAAAREREADLQKRLAEKAARDAEDAKARADAEAERQRVAEAEAAAKAAAEAEAAAEASTDEAAEGSDAASSEDGEAAAAEEPPAAAAEESPVAEESPAAEETPAAEKTPETPEKAETEEVKA